ncbi:helix-turn-helix domain-containing protein [Candidatus Woesearchaeota archaeon]|nr:helix-turn-helix domain-containing protein [Candidatus Woesearchaeota archaeon]
MRDELQAIGFDEKETDIYLALLRYERASVTELLKVTNIERRTIYDVLERLIQQGRASYFHENNTRMYQATAPEVVLEDLKQKEQEFEKVIPQLKELVETTQEIKVEILKGTQGLQTIFMDMITNKLEHYAFGDISPFIYEETYKKIVNKALQELERLGIGEKIIYAQGDPITTITTGEYRAIDKKLITPTPTILYGNTVIQFLTAEPLTIIKITSKDIATTHKQYFNYFWKLAQENKPKVKSKK